MFITGNEVAAGGAGIAVTMVMKPFHFGAGTLFTYYSLVIGLTFFFGKAGGGNDIESGAGDEISGQHLLGDMFHHDLLEKPCLSLGQGPCPEVIVEFNIPGRLMVAAAQGVYEHIDFRNNIVGHFLVLQVPGGTGGPGRVLVVPASFAALKIVVSQPGDARGESLGLLDGVFGFFSKGNIHVYPPVKIVPECRMLLQDYDNPIVA